MIHRDEDARSPSATVIVSVMSIPYITFTVSVTMVSLCTRGSVRPIRCGAGSLCAPISRRTRRAEV